MSTQSDLIAILLAAGEGSRMKSALPKPLHCVAGRSLLAHAMARAEAAGAEGMTIVVGAGGEAVAAAARAASPTVRIAEQTERLGTAHAVLAARAALTAAAGDALILYADTPFIRPETIRAMQAARRGGADIVVLGFHAATPGGYGRLVMDGAALQAIVEAKEADAATLSLTLCNSGVMMAEAATLLSLLDAVGCDNAKAEYYLTDIVAIARERGLSAAVVECPEEETLGVNSRADLAAAEAAFQAEARRRAMEAGVTLVAPDTIWFSHDTTLGADVTIEPHVVFGPGVTVESGATLRAFSHLEGCVVQRDAIIGPYARLRPGAEIGAGARIGNFVEVKNTVFGAGAKANHLAYLGDATVGAGANIGAGVITCNYDGVLKHRTEIGEGAFIGTNSSLVAPVTVGQGAYIASGSVITRDVAGDALAISRAPQAEKPGFAARLRARLLASKKQQSG